MILKVYAILSTFLNVMLFLGWLYSRKELVKYQRTARLFWKQLVALKHEISKRHK